MIGAVRIFEALPGFPSQVQLHTGSGPYGWVPSLYLGSSSVKWDSCGTHLIKPSDGMCSQRTGGGESLGSG